jgi:tRNA pseudouridine38-40 synthase
MPRYKCIVEYDGTHFAGWQRQKEAPSIQGEIEKALYAFCGKHTVIYTAGRTDAGVHAFGQVCHFDLEKSYPIERIRGGLNFHLATDEIVIVSVEEVDPEFHARFSAKKRYYQYRILNRRTQAAVDKYRVWHVPVPLNEQQMQEAANYLIGHHDFTSFRDSQCQSHSPVKTLDQLDVIRQGEELIFYVSAKSFLHHMVRNLVGTLVLVGEGKLAPQEMVTILDKKDRCVAGPTAPAQGLYFMKVDYK